MGLFGTAFKLGMNTGKGTTHLATAGSKIVEGMSSQAAKKGAKELAEHAPPAAINNTTNTGKTWKTVAAQGAVALGGHEVLKRDFKEATSSVSETLGDAAEMMKQNAPHVADRVRESGNDLVAQAEASLVK